MSIFFILWEARFYRINLSHQSMHSVFLWLFLILTSHVFQIVMVPLLDMKQVVRHAVPLHAHSVVLAMF